MSQDLITASINGDFERVKRYISERHYNKSDISFAFRYAAQAGHLTIVEFLIGLGANIHLLNEAALRWAAYYEHSDVVKLLLEHGADRTVYNNSIMYWAVQNNSKEIINIIKNYYPNKKDEQIQEIDLKIYNTDGRLTCYKCGAKLKQVIGFTGSNLNYCPVCEG